MKTLTIALLIGISSSIASATPGITIGKATESAQLDKSIIRRYMRRQISQFAYCYEKELQNNKKLAGTVTTTFTIAESGAVTQVEASGVSPEVSGCVASVVKGIEFPASKGGSIQVNYPFVFTPAQR
jgi:hypothetical protein